MDPQTLTMQAVADELGVDRKALNYHVTDREGLLRLVAAGRFEATFAEAFGAHFEAVGVSSSRRLDDDHPGLGRHCPRQHGRHRMSSAPTSGCDDNLAVFEPAELVLQQMLRAGFDLRHRRAEDWPS